MGNRYGIFELESLVMDTYHSLISDDGQTP